MCVNNSYEELKNSKFDITYSLNQLEIFKIDIDVNTWDVERNFVDIMKKLEDIITIEVDEEDKTESYYSNAGTDSFRELISSIACLYANIFRDRENVNDVAKLRRLWEKEPKNGNDIEKET